MIERIANAADGTLAYIVRSELTPAKTTFVTPSDQSFQMGFVVYPAKSEIQRHIHKPIERHLHNTSEVLLVRSGRCEVDFYDDDKRLVTTRELRTGDVMLMVAGGHGFRLLEDTIFLEVKQGPYGGMDEKDRF